MTLFLLDPTFVFDTSSLLVLETVFDGEIGQEEKGGKDRLLRQEAIGRPGQEQVQLAQVQVGCQVHQQAGHRSDRLRQAPGGFTSTKDQGRGGMWGSSMFCNARCRI